MKVTQVRKRDGRIVKFDKAKIVNVIFAAAQSVGGKDVEIAHELAEKVVDYLNKKGGTPNVEDVQDAVEKVLIESGHAKTAKSFILYRQKRAEVREAKAILGVEDDLKLTVNAVKVLQKRYLRKDQYGRVVETPREMFHRIAHNIAQADKFYGGKKDDIAETERKFFDMMIRLEFLPNSPTLMHAGTDVQQLSACYVLPVDDSIDGIFDTLKNAALIHQGGGGTGFSFSNLRPKGDTVKSTGGVASGPVSFLRVFNTATEAVKQGGRRRGANMGVMRIDHPDILEFIILKEREEELKNFNISVAVTDSFMKAVEKNKDYKLINPRNGEVVNKLSARRVFDLLVTMAWNGGDPGVLFIDKINKDNPLPKMGNIETTNPCGEMPLLPYESCNLGSINLARMTKNGKVNWEKLRQTVHNAVHFLDNVIDVNKFPISDIEKLTKVNRKIGLGVMGFADMLIELGVPYNSDDAVKNAEKIMRFIDKESKEASAALAKKRGSFSSFVKSVWKRKGYKALRNATTTTIAPTGSISIIAGCSSGIEPLFAISFIRHIMDRSELVEVNPLFEKIAQRNGFYSDTLMRLVAREGSIQHIDQIPKDVRRLFVTAHDIKPDDHIRVQAAFQKYTDNAVSKTVNFPNNATTEDVENVFVMAYKLGCKGITTYRDRSKGEQVLTMEMSKKSKKSKTKSCEVC